MSEPRPPRTAEWLESMDYWAHVVVAGFFVVMAASVLVYAGVLFGRQIPVLVAALGGANQRATLPGNPESSVDLFLRSSLELLSSLLFVVVILELLRTVITSLRSHNMQAVMKEFLVVGIISSIRKILLVGAQSSLSSQGGTEFMTESGGTVVSIAGILLLIVGLILLQRPWGGASAGSTVPEE